MHSIKKKVTPDNYIQAIAWVTTLFTRSAAANEVLYFEVGEYDEKKSDGQREKFHAMIGDINKTGVVVIPGRRIYMTNYDPEGCKALLVSWFCKEVEGSEVTIPNPPRTITCPISGDKITIRPSTVKWGKKLTCIFVEWLYATGALAGVTWSEKALSVYEEYKELTAK